MTHSYGLFCIYTETLSPHLSLYYTIRGYLKHIFDFVVLWITNIMLVYSFRISNVRLYTMNNFSNKSHTRSLQKLREATIPIYSIFSSPLPLKIRVTAKARTTRWEKKEIQYNLKPELQPLKIQSRVIGAIHAEKRFMNAPAVGVLEVTVILGDRYVITIIIIILEWIKEMFSRRPELSLFMKRVSELQHYSRNGNLSKRNEKEKKKVIQ